MKTIDLTDDVLQGDESPYCTECTWEGLGFRPEGTHCYCVHDSEPCYECE